MLMKFLNNCKEAFQQQALPLRLFFIFVLALLLAAAVRNLVT